MPEISYPVMVDGRIVDRIVEWVGDQPPAAAAPQAPAVWTPELAHILVAEVMDILYRLPPGGPRPPQSCMPDYVRSLEESYGWNEEKTLVKPTKKEMAKLDLVLSLLYAIKDDRQRIALAGVARGVSLRSLAKHLGCGKTWAATLAKRGAAALASMLNFHSGQFQEFMPTYQA